MYARLLGREGIKRVAEFATLNANYLLARLTKAGFTLAYPTRLRSSLSAIRIKALVKTRSKHFLLRILENNLRPISIISDTSQRFIFWLL